MVDVSIEVLQIVGRSLPFLVFFQSGSGTLVGAIRPEVR